MGRSSPEFGVWFALSSVGYMAGNFLTSRLSMRLGGDRVIFWGLALEGLGALGAIVLAALAPAGGPANLFIPQAVMGFGHRVMPADAIAGAARIRPQAAG